MQLDLAPNVTGLYKSLNRKVNENIFLNTLKNHSEVSPHGTNF